MTQAITDFFQRLEQRGRDPRLYKIQGSMRFDVQGDGTVDHWRLTVDHGRLHVSRDSRQQSDAVTTVEIEDLDRIIRGEDNAASALLRGCMRVEGDWRLAIMLERIFPSPPGTRGPRRRGQEARHDR